MLFELASIANVRKQCSKNVNDQCQEPIAGDLTRPWPRPGEYFLPSNSRFFSEDFSSFSPKKGLSSNSREA